MRSALRSSLRVYCPVEYYNARRPHQGLEQDSPGDMLPTSREGTVRYQKVLGGIIRDSCRAVA